MPLEHLEPVAHAAQGREARDVPERHHVVHHGDLHVDVDRSVRQLRDDVVRAAVAEILGCYLPWRWLKEGGSAWLLLPGAASLALFAWLLTLHGTAAGRVYAAYGGVYVAVAIAWLWIVDDVRPTLWDAAGVALTLGGMAVIAFQPRLHA